MLSTHAIESITRTVLCIPFHERCRLVKTVRVNGWSMVDLYRVRSTSGMEGIGENLALYGSPTSSESHFNRVVGKNVFELLQDDSLGAGIQMALFDLAAKLVDQPCHRLLGHQVRDACPVSWWAQDMHPDEWAEEARTAESLGFTSMKAKARPWFDIDKQLEAVCAAVSPHFKFDIDFNGLLLGVDQAAPLIQKLESRHPNLAILESPIDQADVDGNALLRRKISTPISMHFGSPPAQTAVREGVCDGFVISGGATRVRSQGTFAEHHSMPFWLQLVGTGLTTIWSVHLGAVLKMARWPYIPCTNIYEHPLIDEFTILGGHVPVPDAPGLGVTISEDAVERYRVEDHFVKPTPRQIHTIHWPDGHDTHYPNGDYREAFLQGKLTGFLPGISLDRRIDDGSNDFEQEYKDRFGAAAG
jgi:L-alanine-DL-glutamate epimerase-like enolase superfamily enzyme